MPRLRTASICAVLIAVNLTTARLAAVESDPTNGLQKMADRIDELLATSWQTNDIRPANLADDATFLRRATLDLNGITPTVMEVRQFVTDKAAKREQQIERLLSSPRYATHMANTWRDILLPADLDFGQLPNAIRLQTWLRQQFSDNLPYDAFVAKFLSETSANGPGVFYTALELKPEKLAAKTSQVFLGMQMQCAECHDHPFDDWSQKDFWGYAAFFARLEQDAPNRPNQVQAVVDKDKGEVTIPESEEVVAPKYPGGRRVNPAERGSRRLQLSIWMASRDNPYLPRAAVNRAWAQMFGRGLVEPIDDMSFENQPSHPELLDELAAYFARTGFDLKNLYRTLATTQAYQRASRFTQQAEDLDGGSVDDTSGRIATDPLASTREFAHMNIKTLRADQVYDSLQRFLGPSEPQEIFPGAMIDQKRLQFITQMRMQTRNQRDFERGAAQALMLMNGDESKDLSTKKKKQFTAALLSPLLNSEDRIDALFLASVSRFPTETESSVVQSMLAEEKDQQKVYGDVLWAIINSAEFTLNH